jgi:hypothetical protein
MHSDEMIFYSVFLSAFSAACLGLAVYKLSMFIKSKGCQQSIPQTMLIFEIITNTGKSGSVSTRSCRSPY